ncbi:lactate/malate family dehydrogenase [Mycoplasma tauri]|uniref:L-lactate dehydrogenase n=1 Tax=Mycoplasma tauri TaxID=547987 RepID=A0A953NEN5_9MOLU|nr:L-lactate dehydrogenase [Mycoplasma tauri]MBZ4195558.1 L-lactate dehydrogenase [Mycoplasma tauri]MBZ4203497.1 L-lactate dehydrogenase [Mycoplasma tauri]MBZ4204131.1 L-lactate dehydrogenase [Mycoplasma tauri]MBZ4212467.1 L-lactate dehydrogenase [Mycoplasma tauri]MBZ4218106.1 L-lactate dehydrogenase [Mycoplasma tauri]
MKKIIVVGLGNVGFTYVNIAIARGIQAQWVFVDKNEETSEAHIHDFQDMVSIMPKNGSTFKKGTLLEDSADADVVVITASIPADKTFSDRLSLAGANAKLMKSFTSDLDKAGFKGVVVVAANPCDVMAAAVHYGSKIPANRVISTGTILDSSRFRKLLAKRLNISPDSVYGSVLAEHGSSCMIPWSLVKVGETSFNDLVASGVININELEEFRQSVINEAFYIFSRKGNTQFGIGTSLYEITDAIINNKRCVMTVGVKLPKGYDYEGIYLSIPVIVGENGYEYLNQKPSMTNEEWEIFNKSSKSLAEVHTSALSMIGIDKKF